MSRWTIRLPIRHRDQELVHVATDARVLGGEDTAVARAIALGAMVDGLRTAGELLDYLESIAADDRRRILDHARSVAGLEPIDEVEARERIAAAWSAGPAPPKCAIDGCNAWPAHPGGGLYFPDVRRWHCPQHEHLASAADLAPRGSGLVLSPSGVPIDVADVYVDVSREATERARREAREQERRLDAEERAAAERARRERAEWESPDEILPRAHSPAAAAVEDER